ncbi:glycosyltransferase [Collinsella intestinalis]|uniref:glycosyltransferase n=1 Tax=Collinsella intestinalis TaxID=147207 RepID=UPI00195E7466|nr:glycosyltransferase [Collinsella intestinalis]MBM6942461.1 glycosyltransferase [Collinsella intestinalis]
MAQRATIIIPTYWASASDALDAPGAYDHATELGASQPELERCLASLEKVRDLPRIILLVVCPLSATVEVSRRVHEIVRAHPRLTVTVVTNVEAARIADRVGELAPAGTGECVSLRGYGAIRNMGLAIACILGCDTVVYLDDDEVVTGADFMRRALYALGHETRQGLPILAKTGYFYDRAGSPLADTSRAGLANRWWTKRPEFNAWMKRALASTRISRSNYVCGGCLALTSRAFAQVPFDPFITRGEDLDYLFNLRLIGLDMWFDNQWSVRHLPPESREMAPRFMQDVYRWYYERAKLVHASHQNELVAVTPASLMPYPGPWISGELDERVRKTALIRMLVTREHLGYLSILRRGRAEAERYARDHQDAYLRFWRFWPTIVDGLWNNRDLAALMED